ncbi:PQQ-binding-like beta-propeller repeat protein [Planctomyces sp. SH-PL14]|uniref:PQQ-binding-like beta-propeller repeat protein n=1 Tax=Planctomyces sp. SH-PL14 TaxID=1632864 RepID=UPI00078B2CE0|nr:PQQ-binding-like beta-propeller repeat protein [Planctomyces sp. SH-PL14]AMV18622.1 outer membrane biogenesis protein BamB [Planctomyces sp. SH-PL14]
MRRTLAVCSRVVLCASLAVAAAQAADWPQWRGPARDGISKEQGMRSDWEASPPKLLWELDGMGGGYASVAVVGDRLYTTGNTEAGQSLICVDLPSKKIAWSTPLTEKSPKHGYEGARCTPTIDGDQAYAVSSDGAITCVDVKNGEINWTRKFSDFGGKMMSGWGFSESPLVDGDRVLCTPGGPDAMIVCLDKKTGGDIWKTSMPNIGEGGKDGAGYSSIVISNAVGVKQYVQLVGRGVIGVRASDGQYLWGYNRVANGVANIPTPVVSGDSVFASTGYGTGSVLLQLIKDGDGVRAEEKYFLNADTFQNHHGGMILIGDHIYAGHAHNKGFPICVELKSGEVVWGGKMRPPQGADGSAAVTAVDGKLIFRYQNGLMALIDATPAGYKLLGTFTPVFQEKESWSHPVVVDGKLYLREQNKLMCYDVGKS